MRGLQAQGHRRSPHGAPLPWHNPPRAQHHPTMLKEIANSARRLLHSLALPNPARVERRLDRAGLPARDPGPEAAMAAGIAWLCRAQDCSASLDGGVARDFSLLEGWSASYP